MPARQCAACGKFFKPWPQTPHQAYCSKPECQRARRNHNKQNHRRKNPEIVAEQNRDWNSKHPDYWKQYRETHPDYVDRNRALQKQRNHHNHHPPDNALPSGRYLLTPTDQRDIAKRHSWLVEIRTLQALPASG